MPNSRLLWTQALPFYLVAASALLLMILKIVVPGFLFDTTSLILFSIASFILLLPRLAIILPPLKRLKLWEFEAEFADALNAFERKVEATEEEPPTIAKTAEQQARVERQSTYPEMFKEYVTEYQRILSTRSSNREKIVSAAILVERMVMEAARELGLPIHKKVPKAIMIELTAQGFITKTELEAFDEFWNVRNLAVHSGVEITDEQTARLLDLVFRLVRTFA